MQRRISYFDVDWNRKEQTGGIRLAFDDRSTHDLRPLSMEELSLVCNLLRAEKPHHFRRTLPRVTRRIVEPVGVGLDAREPALIARRVLVTPVVAGGVRCRLLRSGVASETKPCQKRN